MGDGKPGQKVPGQRQDVFGSAAQGWDFDGEYTEPIVEVAAEPAGADFLFEGTIGRCDEAYVS